MIYFFADVRRELQTFEAVVQTVCGSVPAAVEPGERMVERNEELAPWAALIEAQGERVQFGPSLFDAIYWQYLELQEESNDPTG